MSDDLIKELRSYPRHYEAAHKAADALEKANRHTHVREYYNIMLEDALVKLELREERLRGAAVALIDFHNAPVEQKRPDVFTLRMRALAAAIAEEKK